ncbi:MAG: hypothetical protein U9Q69_04640 [Nanoarchaeota archaeon]|nr:hypothetical protein [Nanoarchaeota archaeon]
MDKNTFGIIWASEGFGKPMSLEVQVLGLGSFADAAEKTSEIVNDCFIENGLYVFRTNYSAIHIKNSKTQYYNKKNKALVAHEEFHEQMDSLGLANKELYHGIAYTYYCILNESLAKAKEYQVLLAGAGNDKIIEINKKIKIFSDWGNKIYALAKRVIDAPNNDLETEVLDIMKGSFFRHKDSNWLCLLCELQYFGFFDACCNILSEKNNLGIIKNLYRYLEDDSSGKKFLDNLNNFSQSKKDSLVKPFFKETLMKSLLKYVGDKDEYKLIFHAPFECDITKDGKFLRDIQLEVRKKIGPELERLGSLQLNIWANYLKMS